MEVWCNVFSDEGLNVGVLIGIVVVGAGVGFPVTGASVGGLDLFIRDGGTEGLAVGFCVGLEVCCKVCSDEGLNVGLLIGIAVVPRGDGAAVGSCVTGLSVSERISVGLVLLTRDGGMERLAVGSAVGV